MSWWGYGWRSLWRISVTTIHGMCMSHREFQEVKLLPYVTGFDKGWLLYTQWQGRLFTTFQFLHQWTNNTRVYHCQCFPGLLFLGLVSWACLMCLSARVVFKWQWCNWKDIHLAGNCHMTGQRAWPSNWLLFVISRAQMGLKWEHLVVFSLYTWKNLLLHGSPPPPTSIPT